MTVAHVMGVDLGTSEVKATLFNREGRALADAMRSIPIYQPRPGLAEQDPDGIFEATLVVIREVVDRAGLAPGQVAAVAFAGQMAGAMGIDEQWQPVTPWYPSALDTRYQPYAEEMRQQVGSLLRAKNGALPFLAPRILWWRRQQPDVYRRIRKAVLISTYVSGKMAGLSVDEAFIDPTYLCFTGVADTARKTWSEDLCQAFDIPMTLLSRVVPCTEMVGTLSREAAEACGLQAGTPLVAGAGDSAAAFLGAGVVEPGQLIDISGTFSAFGACVDHFSVDTEREMLVCFAGPVPDTWYAESYISGGGLTHRWFRDQFGGEELAQAEAEGREAYQILDEQAQQVPPGSEGLFFVPHLAGRACPEEPAVRGMWLGFTWTHTKAHFYRALLEAIAYDYRDTLETIRRFFPELTLGHVHVVGGGGASSLWNQIKADALGLPVARLEQEDMSALGSAIIAGHAVGLFSDMTAAAHRFVNEREVYQPRPQVHATYEPYVAFYRRLYEGTRDVYADLAQLRSRLPDQSP